MVIMKRSYFMKFSRLMTCVLGILVTGMMLSCSGSGQQNATGQNNSKTVAKLVGSELPVSTANDDQQNPQVIYLPDRQMFFSVWEDWRNRNVTGSDIYGQFINPDGSTCSSAFPITRAAGNQTVPQVAYRQDVAFGTDSKLVVTWQDTRGLSNGNLVVGSGDGVTKAFSGTLPANMRLQNNIKIIADSQVLTDNGAGILAGTAGATGTVDYVTGAVSVTYTVAPATGVSVLALGNYGYVYYAGIGQLNIPTTATCGSFAAPSPSNGTPVNFNIPDEHIAVPAFSAVNNSVLIGNGDGIKKSFTPASPLVAPVLPKGAATGFGSNVLTVSVGGVVALTDTGNGGLSGVGSGTINYTTGAITVDFNVAPAVNQQITASYSYQSVSYSSYTRPNTTDYILSRRMPKIVYDPIRDNFWLAWIESRGNNNSFNELYFPGSSGANAVIAWEYGDNSFPGYAVIKGSDLSFDISRTGVVGADVVRNSLTRTSRFISGAYTSGLAATAEYEFFTNITNVALAVDTTSPKVLLVWDGLRYKGTLDVKCTDTNNNTFCDAGEAVASTFTTTASETGLSHIYTLFDTEIYRTVVKSRFLENVNPGNQAKKPAAGFDPVFQRFFVVWEDMRDGLTNKIWGQLIDSSGSLYNNNVFVGFQSLTTPGTLDANVASSSQTSPAVSYDTVNQRYFVAWQDGRNGQVSNENLDIYGQYVDGEGSLRGANYVITTNIANQLVPAIVYNTFTNQFLALWKDARNTSATGSDIYGQLFSLGQPQLTLLNTDNSPLTPTILDFSSVPVGTSSYKSFKVRNTGDVNLTVTSAGVSGSTAFSVTPTTASVLPPGASQIYTVTYTPVSGSSNASVLISSDATNVSVSLSGLGVTPVLTASTTAVTFSKTDVNQTQTSIVKLTNSGTIDITINSITGLSSSGMFSNTPGLAFPQTITAGNSLDLWILFAPTQLGDYSSTLSILTNLSTTNQTISITGTGVQPVLATDPAANGAPLDFGSTGVGATIQKTFRITNKGNKNMTVNSLTVSTGFNVKSTVTTPLLFAPGEFMDVPLLFSPSTNNAYVGTLSIVSDGGNGTITLAGQGTAGVITLAPSQIDFGTTSINQSVTKIVTVSNTGNAPLSISAITTPDNALFSTTFAGTLPITLNKGTSIPVSVTFKSSQQGYSTSSFNIVSDAYNGTQTITLQASTSSLAITTTSPLPAATSGTIYKTTLGATGGTQPYTWSLVTPNGGALPTGLSLDPSTGRITGTPTGEGTYVFVVQVVDVTGLSSQQTLSIDVPGTGGSSLVTFEDSNSNPLSSSPYSFGNQLKGYSVTKKFKILNSSLSTITFNGASVYKPSTTTVESSYTTTFPTIATPVAAKGTLDFTIIFTPGTVATVPAQLILTDTNGGKYTLNLTGTGSPINVTVDTSNQAGAYVSSFATLTAAQYSTVGKPSNLNVSKVVDMVINGVTAGVTIPITVTVDSIPSNAVFYKLTNNVWTKFTPDSVDLVNKTITYRVKDSTAVGDAASAMDSDPTPGVIHDPVVVATLSSSTTDTVTPPPSSSGGGGGGGGCFIATAAYGSYLDPHVMVLRHFRDDILLKSEPGTAFVRFYYKQSPPIADFIAKHPVLKLLTRFALTPLIFAVKYPLALFGIILAVIGSRLYRSRRLQAKELLMAQQS